MGFKTTQRYIFKLHTKDLKNAGWNIRMDFSDAIIDKPDWVISISDCQLLRWIDRIRGRGNVSETARIISNEQKQISKEKSSKENKKRIRALQQQRLKIQYVPDVVDIVMDSKADYDRANAGFKINGIVYRRLLGTAGGIKQSTIRYISADIYLEISRLIDNGRDKTKELIPAKLEAYQALVCSSSVPLPPPKGIIVVKDCITHFKDDVIVIENQPGQEPLLSYMDGYDVEHNNSDGCGMMSPEYSRKVHAALHGGDDRTTSGINVRWAWTKGMLFTFDFQEFAEKVAGTYEITDVWGQRRNIQDADIILTESMVKLWNCYSSYEDFFENCQRNGYEFSAQKDTPDELENARWTSYQILQCYDFSEDELQELCQPTIDDIKDIRGRDYRKTIVYLAGMNLQDESIASDNTSIDNIAQALMYAPEMINDPYIIDTIRKMIEKRIDDAKIGKISVSGNYQILSGDLYALAQSMFGLEITGLLEKGEAYSRYWNDKEQQEIVCYRHPMSVKNNIVKMRLRDDEQAAHWFRYIDTALILNAFDSTCDALNGCDFDSDAVLSTDDPILMNGTQNTRAIRCVQSKGKKKIVTEEDIIESNKVSFGNNVGAITNRVTSMYAVQADQPPDSEEFKTLEYRKMCGQLYQQDAIDAAKGIIPAKMPKSWYSYRDCIEDGDKDICAEKRPYFLQYRYADLRKKYREYQKKCEDKMFMKNIKGIQDARELVEQEGDCGDG